MSETKTTIKYILRDFWQFLLKPTHEDQTYGFSVILALKLFLALFIVRIVGVVLEITAFRPLVLHFTGEALQKQQQTGGTLPGFLIGSLLSAPIFEELAYRWGLRFSPLRVAVSLGLLAFYWLPYGGSLSTTVVGVLDEPGFYLMVGMALVVGLTAYALLKISFFAQTIRHWWKGSFGWVFYGSSLLFGLMHVFNVREVTAIVASLAFFITFQQIVMGLFNGYIRIRHGFKQAVVQHALYNLVFVLIHFGEY